MHHLFILLTKVLFVIVTAAVMALVFCASKLLFVALSHEKIVKVACGRSHTLLATGYLLI